MPTGEPAQSALARDYLTAHAADDLVELSAENSADYRTHAHRAPSPKDRAELVAGLLQALNPRLIVPPGIPISWLPDGGELLRDDTPLAPELLDGVDAVMTGCALAIALDAGLGQGRRVLTPIPDHHICVIDATSQIVPSAPETLPTLDPARPLERIDGPSATGDIKFDRVEGACVRGRKMSPRPQLEFPGTSRFSSLCRSQRQRPRWHCPSLAHISDL